MRRQGVWRKENQTRKVILSCLNQAFDFSEPVRYTAVVEDTSLDFGGSKGITKYEVQLDIDGEIFKINVPFYHYFSLEKGDRYIVEYRKGAFNEPYYIGVGKAVE